MKYLNLVIFTILLITYTFYSSQIKFSTNFLEIFFSQKSIELFTIAKKLGFGDEVLVAKKGFEKSDIDELYILAEELEKLPQISKVLVKNRVSVELKEYMQKHYWLLSDFDNRPIDEDEIKNRLQKLRDNIYESSAFAPLDTYDPLNLFSLKSSEVSSQTKLKDFGYIIRAKTNIDTANTDEAKVLYDDIKEVLKNHPDTISIAAFYYLVENSAFIKNDAQTIMVIASFLLLFLYFVILKNHKLFFNTILAIASSIISAILLTWIVFDSISILALVFGISITTISIDYMFHYYFHHSFSLKKPLFQKRVFFGFLTTFGVFVIFSFVDVELFSQLALFAVVSLSVAYLIFSFVFVYLGIETAKNEEQKELKTKELNPLHVVLLSLLMLGYVYTHLEFDAELKNLDYQNEKLLNLTQRFSNSFESNSHQIVLLNAKNRELLLQKKEELSKIYPDILGIGAFVLSEKKCEKRLKDIEKFDFERVKKEIQKQEKRLGFKEGTFRNSYKNIENQKCDFNIIDDMKFKIIKHKERYYTTVLLDKDIAVEQNSSIKIVDLAKSLRSDIKEMKKTLSMYMVISLVFILFVMFLLARKKMLNPLMYLLFPISTALFAITLMGKINIMHIFALVVLLAISIDYGIYMYKVKTLSQTRKAITYALLSTFCGFGVLIFSSTVALFSIGFVVTIGVVAIFLLLYGKITTSK